MHEYLKTYLTLAVFVTLSKLMFSSETSETCTGGAAAGEKDHSAVVQAEI